MEHGTIQLLNCMLKTSHVPVGQNSNMQGHNMTTHGLLKKGGFQQEWSIPLGKRDILFSSGGGPESRVRSLQEGGCICDGGNWTRFGKFDSRLNFCPGTVIPVSFMPPQ